jgi:polyferredoxin
MPMTRRRPKTPYEFFLCLITVALGIAMMLLLVVMYWRAGPSEEFIRAFIVITVIFAALFLIVAGYNEKQTAPVFGLLGTILGYVFGKVASPVTTPDKTKVTQTGSQTGVTV